MYDHVHGEGLVRRTLVTDQRAYSDVGFAITVSSSSMHHMICPCIVFARCFAHHCSHRAPLLR